MKNMMLLFLFLSFLSFGQTNPDCLVKLENKLSPKSNKENKIGEIINLKDDVNCFDWDTLVVMPTFFNKNDLKRDLGIESPFEFKTGGYRIETARLLFVKNNVVVHYIIQESLPERKMIDTSRTIKAYKFIDLTENDKYKRALFYAVIPKQKTVFETQPRQPTTSLELRIKK